MTGLAEERDFPTARGSFGRVARGDTTFVTKLDRTGRRLVYSGVSSGLGGRGLAVDSIGAAYVVGDCACVMKVSRTGHTLVYSKTFARYRSFAIGGGIALDPRGNTYVTGSVRRGFRTTPHTFQPHYGGGANDTFVTKLAGG